MILAHHSDWSDGVKPPASEVSLAEVRDNRPIYSTDLLPWYIAMIIAVLRLSPARRRSAGLQDASSKRPTALKTAKALSPKP